MSNKSTYTLKGNYYLGQWEPITSGENQLEKVCPGDHDQVLWSTQFSSSKVEPVMESAEKGFQLWRQTSIEDRVKVLERYREIVTTKQEQIALAIALETGKPLWEARTEALALPSKVTITIAESYPRVQEKKLVDVLPGVDGRIIYKPIGPSLIIGPFNFPCHLANGQILSALLTGNSIIFKPSEKTIYSSQLMFDCLVEAGFPHGVLNFIQGEGKISSMLTSHEKTKAIFFTGSYGVGKIIAKSVAGDFSKMLALELGGKNTTIVHSDAAVDFSMGELVKACFLTSGQRCTSTSTILLHQNIADEFIGKFKSTVEKIIVGHPEQDNPQPFMGPLIDEAAEKGYFEFCRLGLKNGEELIPAKKLELEKKGNYVSPSVHFLNKFEANDPFTQTEIFGPNCSIAIYNELEQAIEMANVSSYGLSASIFTNDYNTYEKALLNIDSGIFNHNRSTVGASSKLPFGGVKNSGNYRPAGVSMIDATVYSVASLTTSSTEGDSLANIIGLQ
ncbi:aldehyde dehydrogenase family protein [Bacteriovoracaceae bacterium]|nr:aldehyde dehydrogenase family protein [Bacteriovoracaceae bacterium]